MRTILILATWLSLTVSAFAAPSVQLIPFQGRLTNQQGVAYTTGQYTLTFNIYGQASGGTSLWTERHENVGVQNGMVNVFLGSITAFPNSVDFSQALYLGITVDADNNPATPDPEMVPRQIIVPAFFAYNARQLTGFGWDALFSNGNPSTGTLLPARIADGGISTSKIADNGITAQKLAGSSVTSSALATGSVTSAALANGAVTSAALASNSVGSTTIADGAVTTSKIAVNAVSQDRLAGRTVAATVGIGGVALSGSSGSFSTGTNSTDVTNLTVTVVTTGRPVFVGMIQDGAASSTVSIVRAAANLTARVGIIRDSSTTIADYSVGHTNFAPNSAGGAEGVQFPSSAFNCVDFPSAGSHTYKVNVISAGSGTVAISNAKLVAYEL